MTINELKELTTKLEQLIEENNNNDGKFFTLDNEILKDALKQQVELHLRWESLLSNVLRAYYDAETYTEAAYSDAMNNIMSNSNVDYTTTEAKILAQRDTNYIDIKLVYNRLLVLKRECESTLKAIDTRKWMLKGITDLVVQSTENHII